MKRNIVQRLFLFVCSNLLITEFTYAQDVIGKVIDSYTKGDVTHCTLEVRRPLVSGKNISLSNGNTVVIGEQLGEKEGLHYYSASSIGKPKIPPGTDVFGDEIKSFIKGKQMFLKLERKTTFAPKKYGEVTAVQKDRALVDKGSLHEVRERDLYAIYDAQGKYKGKIELRGVGDFQSSGKLYHSLEDFNRGVTVEPGDKIKYLGQRKLFGLGLVVGAQYPTLLDKGNSYGGGLLWHLTFPDGWSTEILFGGYYMRLIGNIKRIHPVIRGSVYDRLQVLAEDAKFLGFAENGDNYSVITIAPTIIKKNLFYPRLVSPFLGVGFGYFEVEYESKRTIITSLREEPTTYPPLIAKGEILSQTIKKRGVFPIFAGGINFFSGKFFQIRADAKYFMTPELDTGFSTLKTAGFVYSFGFLTAW